MYALILAGLICTEDGAIWRRTQRRRGLGML